MLSALQFFIFRKPRHWRSSVRKGVLRNVAKFTEKHLWQSLFFNKVGGWGDCFWSLSYLLLKITCLFHFNRKMKWKKGNTLMELKYYFFARVSICLTSKISKEIWQMVNWSENVFKGNLMLNTWQAPGRKRLKGSPLNFAHTFLTDCCTKPCLRFS